jgi:hypothetical protein
MRSASSGHSILSLRSKRVLSGLVVMMLVAIAVRPFQSPVAAAFRGGVSGAGKTIIEGGTGGTTPLPVETTVAFHATNDGGDFECLAFVPPLPSGVGSGNFSVNAMYVSGKVTSLQINGNSAILNGIANVTGLGAGTSLAFSANVTEGGPGSTIILNVSGLTFHEILLEGSITFQGGD